MARQNSNLSLCVRTEGGLLPADFLLDLANQSKEIEGLEPERYHLSEMEKLSEAINRAFTRLQGFWLSFKDALEKLPPDDYATSVTKEKWLLPLFDCLGYGRLVSAEAYAVGDRVYKPSHIREHVPIHLVGYRVELDRRSTAGGARAASPHSLIQEMLNQSANHLWAFVSNGRKLRVLRDNVSLTRQAYIEFDIESIFEGDGYADFSLLWLLCHQSRVEGTPPESCWLEKWKDSAQRTGVRVRDQLRNGVERALQTFGTGFLRHRANESLRKRVRNGEVSAEVYYRQILRLIYRLLFLFVTEDRDVLLVPGATAAQKKSYRDYYSLARLRAVSAKRRGTLHHDLWAQLSFVFRQLSSDRGCPELGLPALGSFLWSAGAAPIFENCHLHNDDLLEGLRSLSFTIEAGVRRPVQYGQLESEELGSIYESLLEQIPYLDPTGDFPTFGLRQTAGSERKTTGSYYTPTSLVNCLLDSALDPVLNAAAKSPHPEEAILNLRICDPACGSGHFLIAAAHRVAKRLASARSGDIEPGPDFTNSALRDVISRCIFGVDVNEMAVELCKVSLWLQSAVPGEPLSFLDHKIKCGNSLLGATPFLIEKGIPDAAFDPIEGDDKETVKRVKAFNRQQTNAYVIPGSFKPDESAFGELSSNLLTLDCSPDKSVEDIHSKEKNYATLLGSESYVHSRYICDAWCAAFVWKIAPGESTPITREAFGRIRSDFLNVSEQVRNEIVRLREQYKFFHWHLEFPQVFSADESGASPNGWSGGFDIVLGNPPWERVKLQEQEFFSSRAPEVAKAKTASIRRELIRRLETENSHLFKAFKHERRRAEGESHFIRKSGRYPLCGRGDVNTYSVFSELIRTIIKKQGQAGFIVPPGIATDDTTKYFFQDLVEKGILVSLFSFENEALIFPAVHHAAKFCLLTLRGESQDSEPAEFVFFARFIEHLQDDNRRMGISASDLALINPITRTCPVLRTKRDLELLKHLQVRGCLLEDGDWQGYYIRLIHLSDHKDHIVTEDQLKDGHLDEHYNWLGNKQGEDCSKLYEAKLFHQYDHRYSSFLNVMPQEVEKGLACETTVEEHHDIAFSSKPRYWVAQKLFGEIMSKYPPQEDWLLAYRDVTSSTNERTCIASAIPFNAASVSVPCLGVAKPEHRHLLLANLNSFCLDYAARLKVPGQHLSYGIMKQLPVLPLSTYTSECLWQTGVSLADWISERVLELVYTTTEVSGFGKSLLVEQKAPNVWNEERRFLLKCELDAAFFCLYDLQLHDIEYIMETFPLVENKDLATHGYCRTKDTIISYFKLLRDATKVATTTFE
jgi:hypothetical protein